MSTPSISAIILTKNEQDMIANCLETLGWCNEVIVVDDGSTDMTGAIAERAGAVVIKSKPGLFADLRTQGLRKAKSDWVLYVDADERVSPQLAREIQRVTSSGQHQIWKVRRNDIQYGKWMEHGGWEKDWIERLFLKSALKEWSGTIHESPMYEGSVGQLEHPLVHLTHRNIRDGLLKSAEWTGYEAQLLFEAKTSPVTGRTLLRKTVMEFYRRLIKQKGYKDGVEGWIEALTQAMNRFLVYARLWEFQRTPSLDETYRKIDETILKEWKEKGERK